MEKLVNLRHLDISGTDIEELPLQIVELKNLQTLNVFIVDKRDVGLSVRQLGSFPNLHGKLTIKNLHNVVNANEVKEANMESKEDIEELILQWGKQSEDSRIMKDVFDMLKPSINLKKLIICMYGGTSFPIWPGDSSFANMVSLCLSNCEYCFTLPPLGQLPSLKDLEIKGMTMLEIVGPGFYFDKEEVVCNSSFQPFPSLKKLRFSNMPNWKQWLPFDGGQFPFHCLETLELVKCPELRGHLPSHLPDIEKIEIYRCDHLLETPPTPHWLSSIIDLKIRCTHIGLPNIWLRSACLQHLELYGIPSLSEFPADGLPTSLLSLKIWSCEYLAFLPPERWSNYTSLVDLEICYSCDALTSFPLDGFPALQSLLFQGCKNLESIFISESSSSLCTSTLQSLSIYNCEALRSFPERMDTFTTLESLTLHDLPQLELPFCKRSFLPSNLETIHINSLRITRPPTTEWDFQGLTALTRMTIGGDDIIQTLLVKEKLLLPISLVSLFIQNLSEMKSLEGFGFQNLSSLRYVEFIKCSRNGRESFPKDLLPSSMETLAFVSCKRLESFSENSLPYSLKRLGIVDCPLLEAWLGSESGKHWSNITHIPIIRINDKVTM